MKKFTILIVLQMIILSSVIANDRELYEAICVDKDELKTITTIKQEDGYRLVEFRKRVLIYLDPKYLTIPQNNCRMNKIPLFIQP